MDGWVSVYANAFAPGLEMRRQILVDAEIPCVILNRQDSSYSGVGFASIEVQLMVPKDFEEQAQSLLQL